MRKFRGAYDDIKAALVLAPQNKTVRRNKELIHRELCKQEKFSGNSKQAQKLQSPVEEVLKSEVVEPPENAAALGLLPYSVAVNPKEKQVDQITRNLRLLSVADQFADGVSGLTIPSDAKQEQFLAFRNIATSSSPVPVDKLQNYFNNSTSEGKLYIAALMKKFDNTAGEKRLRSLLRDQTKILYRDGCCIEDVCVAEVAEHLLSPAGLRNLLACENFWSGEEYAQVRKAKNQLQDLKSRSQSKEFADVRINKSRVMIFRLPLEFRPGIPLKELQNGYRVATPAGKLYIAAIMQKYYQPFGERLLTKLLTNNDSVLCRTGPSPRDVPVSQIAMSLLATGKFETFAIEE